MLRDWYILTDGQESGPYTADQLRHLATTNQIFRQSWVRNGKGGDWVTAERVRGLFPPVDHPPSPESSPKSRLSTPPAPPTSILAITQPKNTGLPPNPGKVNLNSRSGRDKSGRVRVALGFGGAAFVLLVVFLVAYARRKPADTLPPKPVLSQLDISKAVEEMSDALRENYNHEAMLKVAKEHNVEYAVVVRAYVEPDEPPYVVSDRVRRSRELDNQELTNEYERNQLELTEKYRPNTADMPFDEIGRARWEMNADELRHQQFMQSLRLKRDYINRQFEMKAKWLKEDTDQKAAQLERMARKLLYRMATLKEELGLTEKRLQEAESIVATDKHLPIEEVRQAYDRFHPRNQSSKRQDADTPSRSSAP